MLDPFHDLQWAFVEAQVTVGGDLAAKWVIHAVGPMYDRGAVEGHAQKSINSIKKS